MKFMHIFIFSVLIILSAAQLASDKCLTEFNRSFDVTAVYYRSLLRSCEQISSVKKLRAEADSQEQYKLLSSSTYENCYSLQQCDRLREEDDAFDCLLTKAWENVQMFNNVSYGATKLSDALIDKIRIIDEEKYKCTNQTVRQLSVETAAGVDKLVKCNDAYILV